VPTRPEALACRSPLFRRPLHLGGFGPSFLGCWAEPMLGPLGSDAAHRLADRPPARSLPTGFLGRELALSFRRTAELISEPEGGQGLLWTAVDASHGLAVTVLHHLHGDQLRVWNHASSLLSPTSIFNYVLTTMC
jgi:hypothetical protein